MLSACHVCRPQHAAHKTTNHAAGEYARRGGGVVVQSHIIEGVGFGFLQSSFQPRPGPQPWWMTVASHFKWMGPLLIAIAVVLAIAEPA
jgi:hypothetical protein